MSPHAHYRQNAVWAGVFLIIATAFLFVGEAIYKPVLQAPDALATAASARSRVLLGILVEFSCVLAIPLVAVALYPVLRRVSEALAVGYVAFRLFEATLFADLEIGRIAALSLSAAYQAAPPADPAALEAMFATLAGGEAWSGVSGPIYIIVFVTGMLMLNAMLWRSRLVPRWIAAWGLVTAPVLGGLAVAALFIDVPPALAAALIAPLALQEMVLALWLIARGFDPGALNRLRG